MQNIDELVNIVSEQIILDELITNCSKEFLNNLEKKINSAKFCKDAEDFLSVNLQSFDNEIINCLSSFYEKHKEDFNSKEAQKHFINIIQDSSIYETVKNNFLDFFKNYLKDNPTNEIRKKRFEENLKEEITIDKFTFESNNKYMNILNKLSKIRFTECTFKKVTSSLIYNKDCELIFENCIFEGKSKYIKSKSTLYSDCRFDIYRHYNITEIKEVVEDLQFYNCTFKKIICKGIYFKEQIFKNNNLYENLQFEELSFTHCEFDKKFLITYNKLKDNNTFFEIKKLDLTDSIFHSKVEMKEINFSKISIFNNTTFGKLADFYNSTFAKSINFEKTTFKDISVFTNVTFKDDVDFKYATFGKLALFKEVIFEKRLNLEDTIIKEEINFLKIKTKDNKKLGSGNIANRETARIIKDSFEQQNNIIEANKFYALEMKEREKELEKDVRKGKNIFEWLVFKIHGLSSNHSQDWVLSLFWILNITFSLFITEKSIEIFGLNLIAYIPLISMIILGATIATFDYHTRRTILLFLLSFMNFGIFKIISEKHSLDCISDKINPFSIMTELSKLDFSTMIYKITIAYLIYQLIVSIRQNTRRK